MLRIQGLLNYGSGPWIIRHGAKLGQLLRPLIIEKKKSSFMQQDKDLSSVNTKK